MFKDGEQNWEYFIVCVYVGWIISRGSVLSENKITFVVYISKTTLILHLNVFWIRSRHRMTDLNSVFYIILVLGVQ